MNGANKDHLWVSARITREELRKKVSTKSGVRVGVSPKEFNK
jgi:hypothetical protein